MSLLDKLNGELDEFMAALEAEVSEGLQADPDVEKGVSEEGLTEGTEAIIRERTAQIMSVNEDDRFVPEGMKKIQDFEKNYAKKEISDFKVGDTVEVYAKIVEEGKKRIQVFEGVVIGRKGSGVRETFAVRKVSYGEGVERTFPLHSPNVEKVVVTKKGSVKRAKLYYLRGKIGKKTKIEGEEMYGEEAPSPDAAPREEGKKEGV